MAIYNGGLSVKNVSIGTATGSGNAITSLTVDGNVITPKKETTFLTSLPDHSHNYYPLSGGILDGHLDIHATNNTQGSYDEGIRIAVGKNGYSTLVLGSSADATTGTVEGQWWIGCNFGTFGRKLYIAQNGSTGSNTYFYTDAANTVTPSLKVGGAITGGAVYGAVWNDLSDSIPVDDDCILEHGYCYCFDGKKYTKSSKYLDDGIIGIHSDTYGFKMGTEEGKKKMDVAVSGFVLAYVDKEYKPGTPLTCTENGYLTEIKKEDKIEYPEKIVATYWKDEPSEEWGSDDKKVKVNGRKWVKIK